jgi:chromosome segregation ATPase
LSKQLLQETAQQRQAAQAEVGRMASQQKFADKREAALQVRVGQFEADLVEARAQREQAVGEVSALRYVNTSLRAQIDEIMRAMPAPKANPVSGLARGRKRQTKASKTPDADRKTAKRTAP